MQMQQYETVSVQLANDEWDSFENCTAVVGKCGELYVTVGRENHCYNANRWLSVIATEKDSAP